MHKAIQEAPHQDRIEIKYVTLELARPFDLCAKVAWHPEDTCITRDATSRGSRSFNETCLKLYTLPNRAHEMRLQTQLQM